MATFNGIGVQAPGDEGSVEQLCSPCGDDAGSGVKLTLDVAAAALMLMVLSPLMLLVAVCVVLESRGPVFYRATRTGRKGQELRMFKFRKMREGMSGPALTVEGDHRLTRFGTLLARTKLDELPQLLNVVRGEMSLVGPRPEDPRFVGQFPEAFEEILNVRPGITGPSQLAFARESQILDQVDPHDHYVQVILPHKLQLDRLYVRRSSLRYDAKILLWTAAAVILRRQVAVDRTTGGMRRRLRPNGRAHAVHPAIVVGGGAGRSTGSLPLTFRFLRVSSRRDSPPHHEGPRWLTRTLTRTPDMAPRLDPEEEAAEQVCSDLTGATPASAVELA